MKAEVIFGETEDGTIGMTFKFGGKYKVYMTFDTYHEDNGQQVDEVAHFAVYNEETKTFETITDTKELYAFMRECQCE